MPEWLLAAVVSSSDGAAPVELRRGSAALFSLEARRSPRVTVPLAGGRETAVPAFVDLEGEDVVDQDGVVVCRSGWRCSGAEERRLPGRDGDPPSPRLWRSSGRIRRRSGLFDGDEARARKDFIVIFFISGLFCKSLV